MKRALVKKLDVVFSEYIRLRGNNTCFICGKTKEQGHVMQCGHLISRGFFKTRWDERNSECSCQGCNLRHEFDYEIFRRKYIEVYGEEQYEKIYQLAHSKSLNKMSDIQGEALLQYYKNKVKEMKK